MDAKNLQKNIENLERELLELKTIQGAIKSATGYTYVYTHNYHEPLEWRDVVLEVVYADGDNEIFSYFQAIFPLPLQIVGNKQKVYNRLLGENSKVYIYSTRPIVSVDMVAHA